MKDKRNIKMNVKKIIKRTLKLKTALINNNLSIGTIPEWDSLAHLNIFLEIKKKYKRLSLKSAANIRSVNDWINLIIKIYK